MSYVVAVACREQQGASEVRGDEKLVEPLCDLKKRDMITTHAATIPMIHQFKYRYNT
jgi:hypothetical protein